MNIFVSILFSIKSHIEFPPLKSRLPLSVLGNLECRVVILCYFQGPGLKRSADFSSYPFHSSGSLELTIHLQRPRGEVFHYIGVERIPA